MPTQSFMYALGTTRAIVGAMFGGSYRGRLPKPVLVALDAGYSDIEFQFIPESIVHNVNVNYAEETVYGRELPIMQYAGTSAPTYSFTAFFFAEASGQSIQAYVNALINAAKYNPQLRRPPLWTLVWGDVIADGPLVIESLGGIKYADLKLGEDTGLVNAIKKLSERVPHPGGQPNSSDGGSGKNLKSVTLDISLKRYEPYDISVIVPGTPKPNTFYHYAKDGETWEHLAAKYYGDASKGDLLRQSNPDKPVLAAGDVALILKKERFRGYMPTPGSIPLQRVDAASTMRASVFESRGTKTLPVYGPEEGS